MRAGVRHGLWLAVAATALCGCETDQQGDVATYRGLSDPPGEAPQYVPGAPLSLELALRLTATHNEQLAIQGERLIQALADQQRLAAALRPTLEFFANFGIEENTGDGVLSSDVGLRGQYRLLTGQSDLRNVRAAEARAEASRWLVLDLREALLVQTARVYYEALRAERSGEVLERSLQTQLERLADARARNEAGFTRPLDVAQIEAQVSRTRAQLIQANQSEGVARAGLALVTNASVAAASLTDGFEPSDDDQDYHGLSRRYRQDVLAAWADADAARLVVDAAIGQHAPSIAINLDYFLARTPDDSLPALASLVAVRVPIFSAGAIEAGVRSAWSVFRERVLAYRLRSREATRDVDVALHRLVASRGLVQELSTQVRVAQSAVELAEAAYAAGLGTNLERVVAQDDLLNAELQRVVAEFDLKIASLELQRACGLLSHHALASPLPALPPEDRHVPDSPVLDRPQLSETPPNASGDRP